MPPLPGDAVKKRLGSPERGAGSAQPRLRGYGFSSEKPPPKAEYRSQSSRSPIFCLRHGLAIGQTKTPPALRATSPFRGGNFPFDFIHRPGVCRGGFLCSRLFSNTSNLPFSTLPVSSKNVNCASLTKKCQANAAISRKFGDVFTKMLNSAIVFMSQEQENILFS